VRIFGLTFTSGITQSCRRSREPSESKLQREPTRLTKQPTAKRVARKSRVDDKIKKRMSMRYADILAPTPTGNISTVPALQIGAQPAQSGGRGSVEIAKENQTEDARVAENKLLDKKDFEPDACEWFYCTFGS